MFSGPAYASRARTLLRMTGCLIAAMFALQVNLAHAQSGAGRLPVEGAPASLNDDLRRLLRNEPEPTSLFEARRQADRAADTVARLMESEGYYAAKVEAWAEGVDVFTRGVRVDHGPLFIYASREIDYIGPAPDTGTQAELDAVLAPIEMGVPARAQPVITIGDTLVARLRAAGYPDARAEPVDALADGREQTVELTFRLQPGLRYAFGDVQVSGLERTRPEFIETLKPWRPGERYSTAKMDEFRSRLAESGIFGATAVRLETEEEMQPQTDASLPARDVVVEVTERARRTIALGASASTSEGAGLDAEWQLRNITGRGDTLALNARGATIEQRIGTTYTRPHIGRYGRTARLGAEVENYETDAFDLTGVKASASLDQHITQRVRASVGLEASYATVTANALRTATPVETEFVVVSGSATAEYIGVRDILDPQDGVRGRVAIEPGVNFGDLDGVYTRLSIEASAYTNIGGNERLTAAVRGRVGTIIQPESAPPTKLFYAGGGGSVRGYEYQSLTPRNLAGDPVGGSSLVETSAELRWRQSTSLGYVAFIDAGAAGRSGDPPFDEMRAGVGFGVRYYAGFGPLRADIAVPLDKRDGDADFQIYLSIGQAF